MAAGTGAPEEGRELIHTLTRAAGETGFRLARGEAGQTASRLRALIGRAANPGVISFAVGLPAAELFPSGELARAAGGVLAADPLALQYALPLAALKARIVDLMAARGVVCRPEQVFLTSGAQQAMDLLARLFLDPGREVLIEETIYEGALLALRRHAPALLALPTSAGKGLDVAAAGARLAAGAQPAFLYTIPSGHNPLGVSLGPERRAALVELACVHRMPILEDDAYGFLAYDGPPAPPLRALDERWVFYLGSFSKILAPALRAGWIVAPEELMPRLSALKHAVDLDTPALGHHVVAAFLAGGGLAEHLGRLRREYRARRDAMLMALADHLPPGVSWNRPGSGLFIWVELPLGADATVLLESALATEKVAFTPGEAFAAGGGAHARHCLRLCFSAAPPEQIEEGIRRLGRATAAYLQQAGLG
jgi:2-aminoadipate transaminase